MSKKFLIYFGRIGKNSIFVVPKEFMFFEMMK